MKKGSKLYSILTFKCPRCHEGDLYKNPKLYQLKEIGDMPEACPNCQQLFSLEPGFYFGAAYISYGLNVVWLLFLFILLKLIFGLASIPFWVVVGITILLLAPWFFRLSRSAWINIFVKYDPSLKPEKT